MVLQLLLIVYIVVCSRKFQENFSMTIIAHISTVKQCEHCHHLIYIAGSIADNFQTNNFSAITAKNHSNLFNKVNEAEPLFHLSQKVQSSFKQKTFSRFIVIKPAISSKPPCYTKCVYLTLYTLTTLNYHHTVIAMHVSSECVYGALFLPNHPYKYKYNKLIMGL